MVLIRKTILVIVFLIRTFFFSILLLVNNALLAHPNPTFIHTAIAQQLSQIKSIASKHIHCYRVAVSIFGAKPEIYAFTQVLLSESGEWRWVASGRKCVTQPSESVENARFNTVPTDEPHPDFVLETIGESITDIMTKYYLAVEMLIGLPFRFNLIHLCILIAELNQNSVSSSQWLASSACKRTV